jgi:hypothetical protein
MMQHRSVYCGVLLLLCAMCVTAAAHAQPVRNALDLVEVITLDSTIHLDIRYATAKNFMGRQMYPTARAFLQRPAGEALVRAHKSLRSAGYGLLVFDGYRPWRVTKQFWDATPPELRKFVASPVKGSRHNRGCGDLYPTNREAKSRCPRRLTNSAPVRPDHIRDAQQRRMRSHCGPRCWRKGLRQNL